MPREEWLAAELLEFGVSHPVSGDGLQVRRKHTESEEGLAGREG